MILKAARFGVAAGLVLLASPGGAQSEATRTAITIEGNEVHFTHVRSRHAGALPLILTHAWPDSVIAPLVDPTAHGGRARDAFHVVIPSVPGGWDPERTARAWDVLMRRLGYRRYVAGGGEWGAFVMDPGSPRAPAGLLAIHTTVQASAPRRAVRGPMAVTVFPGEGRRGWSGQAYARLIYHVRGGPSPAPGQPPDLAQELRTAFASLR